MPFSTPLIFCSSGVATAASTSVAAAPTNVVVTCTMGGTISGYCAMGSPGIATSPSITMTMENTIATIGRLTKNVAMATVPLPLERRRRPVGRPAVAGGGGAGFGVTTVPSRTRCRPSTITFSLPVRPLSITHRLSTRGPTVTVLNATLLSLPTTATLYRFCSCCTARCGTSMAPSLVSTTNCARPYWPGRSRPPGFGNRNCRLSVPVVASTARSTASR